MPLDLTPLLRPRAVALVGASDNPDRIGGIPLRLLSESAYTGAIFPINPKYTEIFGLKCYGSVADLPVVPDLVVLAVSATACVEQLERCGALGVRAALVFAAGFAETNDPEGQARHAQLLDIAVKYGIALAGPNSIGLVNYSDGFLATFAAFYPAKAAPGNVAIVGQSGAMCVGLYNMARKRGAGFSQILNTGNEAFIEASDYIEYLLHDPHTDTVLAYIEHIRDGAKFLRVARAYRQHGKTLAILKVGSSEKGAEATRSHTAALSGSQATYDAAFQQSGVIVARDLTHLADIAYMSRFRTKSSGLGVGMVSVSGAAGAGLSDQFARTKIIVPTLAPATQARLKDEIPSYGMISNPVDVTANAVNGNEAFDTIISAVADDPAIDMVLLYAPGRWLASITPALIRTSQRTGKLFAVIDLLDTVARAELEAGGIAYFDDMHRATQALGSFGEWAAFDLARWDPPAPAPLLPAPADLEPGSLSEIASKRILDQAGIFTVPDTLATSPDAAVTAAERCGYPVVLKVASPDIAHKTNVGGVRLNIGSPDTVAPAVRRHPSRRRPACAGSAHRWHHGAAAN